MADSDSGILTKLFHNLSLWVSLFSTTTKQNKTLSYYQLHMLFYWIILPLLSTWIIIYYSASPRNITEIVVLFIVE